LKACRMRGLSPQTLKIYQEKLSLLEGITPEQENIIRLFEKLARTNNNYSLDIFWRTFNTFFRWCLKNGILEENPMTNIPRPKINEQMVPILSVEDIKAVLKAIEKTKTGVRDRAIFLLMLDTGIRPGELLNLRVDDVDLNNYILRVRGKTGERIVPFSPEARKALIKYINSKKDKSDFFFTARGLPLTKDTLHNIFRYMKKKSGIKRLYPYILRHTAATMMLQNGASLEVVRQILGHHSYEMTKRYLSLSLNDISRAQKVYTPLNFLRR